MAVPVSAEPLVRKFRRFIKDDADLNTLLEAEENTDQFLYDCLVDAVDEINYFNEPQTAYTVLDFPSWFVLRQTATLQYLIGCGIHSARNQFNYSDGSGIQVQDADTYGRYINLYNVLINKQREILTNFKRKLNIDGCYGGVDSEYGDLW